MDVMEGWPLHDGDSEGDAPNDPGVAAVSWQNIDTNLTQMELASFLDLLGFENAYDDVFVVIDGSGLSTGMAFVTFNSMTKAVAFQSLVDGKTGKVFGNSVRPCKVAIENVTPSKLECAEDLVLDSALEALEKVAPGAEQGWLAEAPAQSAGHAKPSASGRNKISSQPAAAPAPAPPEEVDQGAALLAQDKPWVPSLGPPPGLNLPRSVHTVEWPAGVTTAMIRHIACRFKEEDVSEVLDAMGFKGMFDGVRVPRRPMMQSNLGYAFVNFSSPEVARLCKSVCSGRTFGESHTTKLCEVVPAHIQGAIDEERKVRKRSSTKRAPTAPMTNYPVHPAAMQAYAAHTLPSNMLWFSM